MDDNAVGTFDELNNDISNLSPGDVYTMDKDYRFEPDLGYDGPKFIYGDHGIDIGVDNVTINGNGHYIDGDFNTNIFKVTGNNVKIINLTFINSQYHGFNIPGYEMPENIKVPGPVVFGDVIYYHLTDMSPVYWSGDNGLIDGCIFTQNAAMNGGAITWMGNNGLINNTQFINNTVQGIAGAIYMGGENNTISNSEFRNSFSPLSGEAIYLDPGRKNITVKNVKANGEIIIDGQMTNIGADNLLYTSFVDISPFKETKFDIISILYKSITLGGVNLLKDNVTSYFCSYNLTTGDFVLSTYLNCGEVMEEYAGIEYIRQFSFKNITDFSQVFKDAIHIKYTTGTTQIGTILINSAGDYSKLLAKQNYPKFFAKQKDETRQLNIIFTKKLSINSNSCFNIDSTNCDIVTLFGNGSSIKAKNEARNEDKWATNTKSIFIVYDIQVGGFNTAIENKGGAVFLNNVTLHDNKMDYIMDPDWGAAILNTGYCVCNNCTFTNNYCCNGGAIFNNGRLELNNCTFKGNTAYGEGDNVLNVGDGIVMLNGNKITGSKGPITYTESVDTVLSKVIVCVAATASFVLIMGGIILSVITENPLIFIACIGASVALFAAACGIFVSYESPRSNIINSGNPNLTPTNITAPIKIIDEIVFN